MFRSAPVIDETKPKVDLGVFQLIAIIYFCVCGGPFGIEEAVSSAGSVLLNNPSAVYS